MTVSPSRAVAPVSTVCAAFTAQPSAYPPRTGKPDVAPPCGSVRRSCNAEEETPAGGFRQRAEPQAARQDKAAGSCAPRGGHICPRCGQFEAFAEGLLQARK